MLETDTARATTDRATIRQWVEERDGRPAAGDEPGVLRIQFPDDGDDEGEPISWREFFRTFERRDFAFVYREPPGEGESRWYRFVDRATVGEV